MEKLAKYTILPLMLAVATINAAATPAANVRQIVDHTPDSLIIYPESVETDVYRLMENWYMVNYTALDKNADARPNVPASDDELIDRLSRIPTTIEMPFNSVVRNYIEVYTGKKRQLVEAMLGMSLYYMPIFENALEANQLPHELKYLPIIESALNPDAVSRAGATGLWQIMPATARGLGLEVNTLVDERRDPIRSSQAATAYLAQLYGIYNDWSLAIAAYNCGPGNVNKALRRLGDDSGKKDFWTIYPYLPAETRGYVPCFIAATYAMNYYHLHGISHALAKRPILTDTVQVNRRIHFQQIADVLHLPVEELQILNPQYRQQIIPGDIKPYHLVLPANQIYAYILSEDAIAAHNLDLYGRRLVVEPSTGEPAMVDGQEGEWVTVDDIKYHKVARNETLTSISRKYGVTVNQLKKANGGISGVKRGQTIKVPGTKRVFKPKEPQPEAEEEISEVANVAVDNPVETPDEQPEISDITESPETPVSHVSPAPQESPDSIDAPAETAHSQVADKVADTFSASQRKQQEQSKPAEAKADKSAAGKKPANNAPVYHKVKKGESLFKIARENGTTVEKLQKLNNLKGNNIQIGQRLRVK